MIEMSDEEYQQIAEDMKNYPEPTELEKLETQHDSVVAEIYNLDGHEKKASELDIKTDSNLLMLFGWRDSLAKEIADIKRAEIKHKNELKLVKDALEIRKTDVHEANSLGFMARSMVLTTMPHKKPKSNEFSRVNGIHSLTMIAPSEVGLPYGVIPRLMVAYFTTQARRTKNREIDLGTSLSAFMSELEMIPTGGRWGTITRLKDQLNRLIHTFITSSSSDKQNSRTQNMLIVDDADIWWDPQDPEQNSMFPSKIVLGEKFFNEIMEYSVPLDMRILKRLKKSPLALDIYMFLTYRLFKMPKATMLPYGVLHKMFGAEYKRERDFKLYFIKATRKVSLLVPEFNVQDHEKGLLMKPSKLHIPKKKS